MRLEEMILTRRNPAASADLLLPVSLKCPLSHEEMMEFARINMTKDCPWVKSLPAHDGVAIVCGNAPSLAATWDAVVQSRFDGGDIFACNSAAKFCNERGVIPKYQVMLESLPECAGQFGDAEAHLLASIMHPEVFDLSPNPILWHPAMDELAALLNDSTREFDYIGGGVTVGNSAVCLAHTLGYREIHVHGMDSSRDGSEFHAYPEASDAGLDFIQVEELGRVYHTTYGYKQGAVVFLQLAPLLKAAGTTLRVFGTGLLPDMFHKQP